MHQRDLIMNRDYERFPFALKEESCIRYLTEAYKKEAGIDELDEAAADHINQMCQWLLNSDKWGVIMMGSVGNGKTTLMNATMSLLNTAYSNTPGENGMRKRFTILNMPAKDIAAASRKGEDVYGDNIVVCGIDDLGEEPKEVWSYGNAITPIIDILEERYKNRKITLVTTNLDAEGLNKKYGDRVTDRLREMMQVIVFTNPSYRK